MQSLKLIAAAAALMATSAAMAVTVNSLPGSPDPGPFAGQTLVVTFDAPNAPGYSFSGGLQTSPVSIPNQAAAPADDMTTFGYVSSANMPASATLSTPNLRSISFYWGSVDNFNFVDVLGAGGVLLTTVSGSAIPPANGDQSQPFTNRRVNFTADTGEVITGLRLRSEGVAFEFDDFAATTAVPEPASWALLIAGFGMVGVAARRRRGVSVTA